VASFIPANKCVRLQWVFTNADGSEGSVRWYYTYSGVAPSGANLTALAGTAVSAIDSNLLSLVRDTWTSTEVIAVDLTADMGPEGSSPDGTAGGLSGGLIPSEACVVVSQTTARRYRGGHSRVYLPCGDVTKLQNAGNWTSVFAADVAAAWGNVTADTAAGIWAGGGVFTSVMCSFYSGYTWETYGTPVKYRRVATPRATAAFYDVLTFVGKQKIGTQRRRIASTTP